MIGLTHGIIRILEHAFGIISALKDTESVFVIPIIIRKEERFVAAWKVRI